MIKRYIYHNLTTCVIISLNQNFKIQNTFVMVIVENKTIGIGYISCIMELVNFRLNQRYQMAVIFLTLKLE